MQSDFYTIFNEEIVSFKQKGMILVQGDLNARVGANLILLNLISTWILTIYLLGLQVGPRWVGLRVVSRGVFRPGTLRIKKLTLWARTC